MNFDISATARQISDSPKSPVSLWPTASVFEKIDLTRAAQMTCGRSSLRPFAMGITSGLLLLVVVGCSENPPGPARAAVSGTVQLDGVPLAEGTIVFTPSQGTKGPRVSVAVLDGQFAVDERNGPVVGTNKIQIHSTDGPAFDDEMTLASLHSNPRRISIVTVPPIYNTNSQQTADISADEQNVLNFDLKTSSKR